jgi:hypothetical protein
MVLLPDNLMVAIALNNTSSLGQSVVKWRIQTWEVGGLAFGVYRLGYGQAHARSIMNRAPTHPGEGLDFYHITQEGTDTDKGLVNVWQPVCLVNGSGPGRKRVQVTLKAMGQYRHQFVEVTEDKTSLILEMQRLVQAWAGMILARDAGRIVVSSETEPIEIIVQKPT